jgi:hypothetical protein
VQVSTEISDHPGSAKGGINAPTGIVVIDGEVARIVIGNRDGSEACRNDLASGWIAIPKAWSMELTSPPGCEGRAYSPVRTKCGIRRADLGMGYACCHCYKQSCQTD